MLVKDMLMKEKVVMDQSIPFSNQTSGLGSELRSNYQLTVSSSKPSTLIVPLLLTRETSFSSKGARENGYKLQIHDQMASI